MAVYARGVFLCLRAVARQMAADTADGSIATGSIVAVTSISGSSAEHTMAHYDASKAAANSLVRVAARELAPSIRVNAVAPGTTDTDLFSATDAIPGYRERVESRTPLGRIGTPDDVAEVTDLVAAAGWLTGQIITADGGLSIFSPIDPTERRSS